MSDHRCTPLIQLSTFYCRVFIKTGKNNAERNLRPQSIPLWNSPSFDFHLQWVVGPLWVRLFLGDVAPVRVGLLAEFSFSCATYTLWQASLIYRKVFFLTFFAPWDTNPLDTDCPAYVFSLDFTHLSSGRNVTPSANRLISRSKHRIFLLVRVRLTPNSSCGI